MPSSCATCGRAANATNSVQIDDKLIHKRCFKCSQCHIALSLSTFGMYRSSVYCKRHLALITGGEKSASFRDVRSATVVSPSPRAMTRSATASVISPNYSGSTSPPSHARTGTTTLGTLSASRIDGRHRRSPSMVIRSRTNVCVICSKAAYPTESIKVDQLWYHKRCFKCEHCKCRLTMGGFAMINTNAYCKPHFKQLFQSSGGKYDRAFGSIWNNSSDPKARSNTVIRKSYAPPLENGVFAGTAEAINTGSPSRTIAKAASPKTLPNSMRLGSKQKVQKPVPTPTFKAAPAAPTGSAFPSPKKKVTLTAKSAAVTKVSPKDAKVSTKEVKKDKKKKKKTTTFDLPPPPAVTPTPEPSTPVKTVSPSLTSVKAVKLTPTASPKKLVSPAVANGVVSPTTAAAKMNGAEDPVVAFFRALKANNTKTLKTALSGLKQAKKLGVVVSPSSQLTNMTPVEYAYVTRKIPLARVLVTALKEHFDE